MMPVLREFRKGGLQVATTLLLIAPAFPQSTVPKAGLIYLQTIPIPNLTPTGTTQGNFDIFCFNPQTQLIYYADPFHPGISGIDTPTNALINIPPHPSHPTL